MHVTSLAYFFFLSVNAVFAVVDTNETTLNLDGRECKPLTDCFFYQQYIDEPILDSVKLAIRGDLLKHACGLDKHQEIEKGN